MYYEQKGGSTELIQDITVNLPPKPIKTDILFYHFPKSEQYWRRTELPSFRAIDIDWFVDEPEDLMQEITWEEARRQEIIGETGFDPDNLDRRGSPKAVPGVKEDEEFYFEALEQFRNQEFDRIKNGVWFYNNGIPTYITGHYYFYLNWWKMDVGYAKYRDPDRKLFHLLGYVKKSPVDFGILVITKRGVGKSTTSSSVCYQETISKKNAYVGIQSKTDEDAEMFFQRKVVPSYQDLPDFLIPINKNPSSPTNKLDFSSPSKAGKNATINRKLQSEALRSVMDFRNAKEVAYDGETLSFKYDDEVGKTTGANVYKRWEVNRQCLYRDNKKRGWGLQTTTVEDMEKGGGEACKEMWDKSDPNKRNDNGRTISWMIRYFRPASESSRFDKYGIPDVQANIAEHNAEKEALESDPNAYIAYIQKNPENIEEAFATSSGNCPYNAAILQKAQIRLISPDHRLTVKGDFQWKDGKRDTHVEFIRNDVNGMWEISWMDMADNEANQVIIEGEITDMNGNPLTIKRIKRNKYRAIGYDPYSQKKTVFKNKMSDAAAAVYQKYHNPMNIEDEYLNTYVADFAGRYPNPEDAHEQILMAAVFYGAHLLVENNKLGALNYFNNRGYSPIIMDRPPATGSKESYIGYQGIPSNQQTIDFYVGETRTDINNNGLKNKHLRIVQDHLSFDPNNTTKYDSGVSASLAVVGSNAPTENDITEEISITDFFGTTDQSGNSSQFN